MDGLKVFDAYAAYYDLLYKDKNYKEEAHYVHQLIQQYNSNATSILDMGCGTGNHAAAFTTLGYQVHGVDLSDKMIDLARKNHEASNIEFSQGDIRYVRLPNRFDAIVALFHVVCYQTKDADLLGVFETAASHLNTGGVFIFDCWYGPGVVNDPPEERTKSMSDENVDVKRFAKPSVDALKNIVTVNYEVHINHKDDQSKYIVNEKHTMRYLFKEDIETMCTQTNMEVVAIHKWLQFEHLDDATCWNVTFVVQRKN